LHLVKPFKGLKAKFAEVWGHPIANEEGEKGKKKKEFTGEHDVTARRLPRKLRVLYLHIGRETFDHALHVCPRLAIEEEKKGTRESSN